VIAACGQESTDPVASSEPIEHVHGLGINPTDGALFIGTHDGLFRSPEGSATAGRVGESTQDTMRDAGARKTAYRGKTGFPSLEQMGQKRGRSLDRS